MLTYKDALDYIYSFTDYEKKSSYLYSPEHFDLARVEKLLALLDSPHRHFKSIHIAGTKGKGSVAAMSESILRAAGYRTGLYTSPHLHTFRERIQVSGRLIPEEAVASLTEQLQSPVSRIEGITTFEIITVLGFLYFVEREVEFAVLEVGMGGRLDATNVVTPLVAIITSLSYDHTHILGETLPLIAREKAGIIKDKAWVVSAPQVPEAMAVIEEVCGEMGAELTVIGRDWAWEAGEANLEGQRFRVTSHESRITNHGFWIPLLGRHQLINATVVVAAIEKLRQRGVNIPEASVGEGLRRVRWPGRLEILGREPWVVVDGAHNGDSANKLVAAIKDLFPYRKLILVFGALMGHSVPDMLDALLPVADKVILTRANRVRAVATSDLLREVHVLHREAETAETVAEALEQALALASPGDLICATGSFSIVTEVREAWAERQGLEMPERDGE
ncbi:MAG: bifunctional folylpolyglutamate synthase/dihydrofolate synthase [Anaerolineae bacterium]